MLAGGCLVLCGISADTPFAQIWWPLPLMGGGVGFVVPPMTAAELGAVERTQSGIASGVLNATRQAGSVIGVAVCGSLVADGGHFARGTHVALYLSAALLLLALGVGLGYLSGPTPQRAPVQSSTLPYSGRGGAPRRAHEQQ
jgi:DHA2 family methylenomycin A resistance protein-like MFS transporter